MDGDIDDFRETELKNGFRKSFVQAKATHPAQLRRIPQCTPPMHTCFSVVDTTTHARGVLCNLYNQIFNRLTVNVQFAQTCEKYEKKLAIRVPVWYSMSVKRNETKNQLLILPLVCGNSHAGKSRGQFLCRVP